jgi:hypothetical protein
MAMLGKKYEKIGYCFNRVALAYLTYPFGQRRRAMWQAFVCVRILKIILNVTNLFAYSTFYAFMLHSSFYVLDGIAEALDTHINGITLAASRDRANPGPELNFRLNPVMQFTGARWC